MIRHREPISPRRRPRPASEAVAFLGRDARLADRLREALRDDGWDCSWSREEAGAWCATISSPAIPHAVVGRGGSRIAAISRAHVAAIRFLAASKPNTQPHHEARTP